MKTKIRNSQTRHRVCLPRIRLLTEALCRLSRTLEVGDHRLDQLTLVLTGDRTIAGIKQQVFGYTEATDVIALRYALTPIDPAAEAEVFVNVQRAFRHPGSAAWPPARELALYIAHGIDHLCGADDDTPAARRTMRRRELRWLRHPSVAPLIPGLLPSR